MIKTLYFNSWFPGLVRELYSNTSVPSTSFADSLSLIDRVSKGEGAWERDEVPFNDFTPFPAGYQNLFYYTYLLQKYIFFL